MSIWKRVRPWIIPAVVTLLFCLVLRFVVLIGYVPSASMEPTIKKEEEIYAKKLEDEENQRLIRENTGSISVKKTGKTKAVQRDIEEIKEANEEISNDAVKVSDFTKKKTTTDDKTSKSTENVIKKGRINR